MDSAVVSNLQEDCEHHHSAPLTSLNMIPKTSTLPIASFTVTPSSPTPLPLPPFSYTTLTFKPIFLAVTHTLHMHNNGCMCERARACVSVGALQPICWRSSSRWFRDTSSDICAEQEADMLYVVGLCMWVCVFTVGAECVLGFGPPTSTCIESLSPLVSFPLLAKSRLTKYKCANTWLE